MRSFVEGILAANGRVRETVPATNFAEQPPRRTSGNSAHATFRATAVLLNTLNWSSPCSILTSMREMAAIPVRSKLSWSDRSCTLVERASADRQADRDKARLLSSLAFGKYRVVHDAAHSRADSNCSCPNVVGRFNCRVKTHIATFDIASTATGAFVRSPRISAILVDKRLAFLTTTGANVSAKLRCALAIGPPLLARAAET
mmetsp:Transcript_15290/g.37822  ORF Transcript_15290/g.37822 Transcript_15290/m.37822 type:complete len:202 (-) Transcript_15290:516-1121(-)